MEMQGRRSEGIEWLTMLAPNWEGSHNLQHHLWWHCALFRLEYGDTAGALELYDTRFRNLTAPLTVAAPDVYIDVQNAASALFRLQRLGVDVGNRWDELADKAEARIAAIAPAPGARRWRWPGTDSAPLWRKRADRAPCAPSPMAAAPSPASCATTRYRSPGPSSPTPPDVTLRPSP